MEIISQVAIFIFGAGAVWFVSRKEKWSKWGYIFGALGQPFWLYTALHKDQWGIAILTLFYFYSWGQGIWFYWIKPWIKKRNNK